jgi:hypothetical protein
MWLMNCRQHTLILRQWAIPNQWAIDNFPVTSVDTPAIPFYTRNGCCFGAATPGHAHTARIDYVLFCDGNAMQVQVPHWVALQSLRLDLAQPGAASSALQLGHLLEAMQPGQRRLHTLAVRGHTSISDRCAVTPRSVTGVRGKGPNHVQCLQPMPHVDAVV